MGRAIVIWAGKEYAVMGRDFSLALKRQAIGYTVAYADGLQERYVATYTANVDMSVEQRCESPATWWLWKESTSGCGSPVADGRGCTWTFRTYILRKLAMINRAGEQFPCRGDDIEISPFGCDDASEWLGRHEQTCGLAGGGADHKFAYVVARLKTRFDGIVVADSKIVHDYFKYYLKNVTAVSQSID